MPVIDERDAAGRTAGHQDEDAADVRRVLAGDRAAFAGIVERWQYRLVNLAWRFCRDRTFAEDMAQEAFVRAFRALSTYRGESAFSTWLTAIALNSYRSALRSRPPSLGELGASRARQDERSNEPGPLAGLMVRERSEAVRRMVLTLPARYRDPIVLYYFEEMKLAETAHLLGIREGTLKARLHRARKLLGRRLAAAGIAIEPGSASEG